MSAGNGIYILNTPARLGKGTCGHHYVCHCKVPHAFVAMPGGRVKRCKNRRDNFYSAPEWKRPERRLNGFNVPEVREYFDGMSSQLQEDADEAAKARLDQERHDRILARYKYNPAPPIVVSKGRTLARSRPKAGRVIQDKSGKLVYAFYLDALAA
jgi:hypothetical protein